MSPSSSPAAPQDARRQRWLSLLAKAPADRLNDLVDVLKEALGPLPRHEILRPPEIGLVMVRGRISGSGAPFCVGEITTTRAAVRLASGEVGIGYVAGRHARQAEIVALIDALGQCPPWREPVESLLVAPLEAEAMTRHQAHAARAAATRVEFFTVAREGGA